MHRSVFRFALLLCLLSSLGVGASADVDWPGLRGPDFDGAVRNVELFQNDQVGLSIGWKKATGSGYSALAVGDGKVVSMFAAGESDVVAAFDIESGDEIWRYEIGKTYAGHDGSHDGPIATPLMAGGKIYGLGAWGDLFALDASSGEKLWGTNLAEDHGGKKPHYGFAVSPVLVGDVLVVETGAEEGKAIAGFDAKDGSLRWAVGDDKVNYQSPIAATIDERHVVLAVGDTKLFGIDPAKGEILFTYEHQGDGSALGSGSAIPVPAGENRFFLLNKTDTSAMLEIKRVKKKKWEVTELWSNNAIRSTYVSPVYKDGYLYGISGRVFTCVNAATGETMWKSRQPGDGFPTLIGNYLAVITKSGSMHIVEASPEAYNELAQIDLFEEHSWSEVAYADGHLFARSMSELARIDPFLAGADEVDEVDQAATAAVTMAAVRTGFDRFLEALHAAEDKSAMIDAFLAEQSSFPIIEGPDMVHFVYRGETDDVGIVGDMVGFRREDPMTKVPGTDLFYYSTRLEPDAAVSYGYIPNYDEAIADPLNDRATEGLFGEVSWFAMPAWQGADFLGDADAAKQGTLEPLEWESAVHEGKMRSAQIYLPAGYSADETQHFPVVYFHDGKVALEAGQMKNALDQLIGVRIQPLIGVFVIPDEENPRADGDREKYAKLIAEELVPAVDAKFRTIQDPRGRATVGAASAAASSMFVAFSHPELFGRIGSLSAILNASDLREILPTASTHPMVMFFEWGTYHLRSPHEAWDFAKENRESFSLLREKGFRPAGGERPEGFGWPMWSARTDDMLTALFPLRPGRS